MENDIPKALITFPRVANERLIKAPSLSRTRLALSRCVLSLLELQTNYKFAFQIVKLRIPAR